MMQPVLDSAQKLRLLDLFKAALELAEDERLGFVQDACSKDRALAAELTDMLELSTNASDEDVTGEATH